MNSGFDMPKAWDITNTTVQLESKSLGRSPERAAGGLAWQAEAATQEAAGTARSDCSPTALWSQPSLLPVAHKPAQHSSEGPRRSAANHWT